MGNDVHAERVRQFRHGAPDAAETDQAHRQAIEFEEREIPVAPIRALCPAAGTHRQPVMTGVIREFEQQRKRGLGNGARAVGGNVGDRNAALARRHQVHDVRARGEHTDVFQC